MESESEYRREQREQRSSERERKREKKSDIIAVNTNWCGPNLPTMRLVAQPHS